MKYISNKNILRMLLILGMLTVFTAGTMVGNRRLATCRIALIVTYDEDTALGIVAFGAFVEPDMIIINTPPVHPGSVMCSTFPMDSIPPQ
jgi:hypothetical protein